MFWKQFIYDIDYDESGEAYTAALHITNNAKCFIDWLISDSSQKARSTMLMISTLLQVYNMANLSVSWIRRRDSHILTVDTETFISDPRFAASVRCW